MSSRTLLPVSSLLVSLLASTAHAANMTGPLNKSDWTASAVPDYIDMYIALPDTLPEKPPIVVNIHSCGNNAGGQWSYDGFAPLRAAMDSVGFIMILPQQSRNCWNVGKTESLTHDGGGDTGAIVQMVKYALETYNGDPTRVYVMGGSGGGMTTQALLAVYPEIFKAGSERAGVAAGCWAEGYEDGMQWSNSCAGGSVDKTAQQWGDFVRAINPDFTGPRPRIQLNHGNADSTINFKNFGESIEQWTNVLGLDITPTSTDTGFSGTAKVSSTGSAMLYDRQFWQDDCGFTVMEAWEALNQEHNMGYESEAILKWFGLDEKRDQDPWDAACGGMTVPPGGDGSAGSAGAGPDEPTGTAGSGGTGPTEPGAAGSGGIGTDVPPSSSSGPGTGTGDPAPVPTASQTVAPPVAPPSASTAAPIPPATTTGTAVPPAVAPVATPGATNTGTAVSNTAAPAASSSSPTLADDAGDSGGGCTTTGRASGSAVPFALIALGLLLGRRRRSPV